MNGDTIKNGRLHWSIPAFVAVAGPIIGFCLHFVVADTNVKHTVEDNTNEIVRVEKAITTRVDKVETKADADRLLLHAVDKKTDVMKEFVEYQKEMNKDFKTDLREILREVKKP